MIASLYQSGSVALPLTVDLSIEKNFTSLEYFALTLYERTCKQKHVPSICRTLGCAIHQIMTNAVARKRALLVEHNEFVLGQSYGIDDINLLAVTCVLQG